MRTAPGGLWLIISQAGRLPRNCRRGERSVSTAFEFEGWLTNLVAQGNWLRSQKLAPDQGFEP
jgi:hypothetical protein